MQRVVVIGNSGGGKSVLARRIAARFELPHFEIDRIMWRPGWQLVPEPTYRAKHARIIAGDRWVIDGLGRQDSIAGRLARATDIVLIDLPLWVHFWLAAERQVAWAAGGSRNPPAGIEEMPPTRSLFQTIWEVDRNWLPELRRHAAAAAADGKNVVNLTSLDALDRFAAGL
jgi:adenylate kinase family enzyme